MKCPTLNCPINLPVHGRKKFCYLCRASMAYHARKRAAEIEKTSIWPSASWTLRKL
jgi:hypothetical protein